MMVDVSECHKEIADLKAQLAARDAVNRMLDRQLSKAIRLLREHGINWYEEG